MSTIAETTRPKAPRPGMTQIEDLEVRLREQERWAAEHDGRINAKWESQEKNNTECSRELARIRLSADEKFTILTTEIGSLKVKVAAYAAGATVLATVLINLAKYLLTP